jgi:hypothetical protein
MSTKKVRVGNVTVEIPESYGVPLGHPPDARKTVAGRGDEAKAIETPPAIPNPNDFVGSYVFQAYAIGRIGTSNKSWVNIAGVTIFAGIPIALMEAACIWVWVQNGKWIPFVIANLVIAFILWRKDKPPQR